jgi:uncharacterized protein
MTTAKLLSALTDSDVADYLLAHPDFLLRRSEVLDQLLPPQRELGDSVTDFQRFLVARLKGQIEALKERQQDFIVASRLNEMNLARIHGAALRLCEARSLEELAAIIHTELPDLCQVDGAALAIESDDLALPETVARLKPGHLERWLGPADVLLQANAEAQSALFGEQASRIRSFGVLRIEPGAQHPTVCLAFGSYDPEWFTPDQATDLISFLAGIVSRRLAQLLP